MIIPPIFVLSKKVNMPVNIHEYASVDAIFEMMQKSQNAYELFYQEADWHKNKLFLICPTSHVEILIKEHFDGEMHFLSCLGTVLHPKDENFCWQLKDYIETYHIKEICLIQDLSSPFLKNVLQKRAVQTFVEDHLASTLQQHKKQFSSLSRLTCKKQCLATINLRQQSKILKQKLRQVDAFDAEISLQAFIYQPKERLFTKISLT